MINVTGLQCGQAVSKTTSRHMTAIQGYMNWHIQLLKVVSLTETQWKHTVSIVTVDNIYCENSFNGAIYILLAGLCCSIWLLSYWWWTFGSLSLRIFLGKIKKEHKTAT